MRVSELKNISGLEIESDEAFQRREWQFERCGRAGMYGLIALALVGVFGKGGLSAASRENADMRLDYERFVRWEAPTELSITAFPRQSDEVRLRIGGGYLSRVQLTEIVPAPLETISAADEDTYVLRLAETGGRIKLHVTPNAPGMLRLDLRLGSGEPLRVRQFVWP